uniref:Uncharacterized protein n=1 Tax=Amphiprion ocellaris TaxID=80972 RepID=A0AAQ5WYE3_AMPOC
MPETQQSWPIGLSCALTTAEPDQSSAAVKARLAPPVHAGSLSLLVPCHPHHPGLLRLRTPPLPAQSCLASSPRLPNQSPVMDPAGTQ